MNAQPDTEQLPLRDIHLPDAISWWPPASGWWILFLIILLLIAGAVYFFKRKKDYRYSSLYLARQELEKIKNDYQLDSNNLQLAQNLSVLLRRICISVFDRNKTASMTGKEWLQFLDEYIDNREFSQGIGSVLITAPYQATVNFDHDELLSLVTNWIGRVEKEVSNK